MNLEDLRCTMLKNPDPKRRYALRTTDKINTLVLHCTDADTDVWANARYHVTPSPNNHISKLGIPGLAYHFFVEKDGKVQYCQDVREITWHAGNHNGKSVGVVLRYRATGASNSPGSDQREAAKEIMAALCLDLGVDPDSIVGHRELIDTGYTIVNGVKKLRKECPGMLINLDQFRKEVAMIVQNKLASLKLYNGKIDGMFGPKSEAALWMYRKGKPVNIIAGL